VATPQVHLGARFVDAVAWVTELHADQGRKGRPDVPYVSHLLAVAALALEDGGDESDAIVALCHDAVEDQGGTEALDEVRRRFGEDVAECVDLLSDSHGSHDEAKAPWAERKARLLAQLARPGVPPTVLRVAAADKLHNARSIVNALETQGHSVWDRFRAPPGDLVWFYQSVADLLADRFPDSTNVPELQRVCASLARWAEAAPVSRLA
jgi:(p)ppGpp synthase/HD superfamily hydrolase